MDEAPFVERRFELDGHELLVRFHAPGKAPGGEYRCRFTIPWPEGEERRHASGEDGVQALLNALRAVHYSLLESEAYKAGRLTLWEQADLDLPPTWGDGPLHYPPRRQDTGTRSPKG